MRTIRNTKSKLLMDILLVVIFATAAALFFTQGQTTYAFTDSINSEAVMERGVESAIFGKARIEDDFADDRILVVLNRQETLRFRAYTTSSFPEIDLVSVENLTASSGEIVSADISRQHSGETNQTRNIMSLSATQVSAEEFKTVLRLTLKEPSKENVLASIERLRTRSDILSAEPDYVFEFTTATPNDTFYTGGNQWGLNGTNGIRAPQAWTMATGANTVLVGVIDSGIQANHPDLEGRVNTALSRDFTLPAPHIPTTVTDTNGHGTHVAGIIGAQGNNNRGITGVAQSIQLVSLRISQVGGTAAAENTFA